LDHRVLEVVDEPDPNGFRFTSAGGSDGRESEQEEQDLAH
jgi:hypothetical protein